MPPLRILLRARWLLLAAAWLAAVPTAWDIRQGDWHYFVSGSRLLAAGGADGGLHVLGHHPELHMGPLSLAVAWLARLGGTNGLARVEILMWLLGPVTLLLLERAARRRRGDADRTWEQLVVLAGGWVLLRSWTTAAGVMGHVDDVLTMTFAALAVYAAAARRPALLVLAVGLATGAKAWGVVLLPLCAAPHLPRPRRTLLAGTAAVVLPWVPFVIADRATLTPTSFDQAVDPASALRALGVAGAAMPHWVRPAQVLLGLALAALLVRSGRWAAALAAAVAVRIALDPAIYNYYTPTLVLAALVLDLVAARRPLPVATLAAFVGLAIAPWYVNDPPALGWIRLATALAVAAAALALPGVQRRRATSLGRGVLRLSADAG